MGSGNVVLGVLAGAAIGALFGVMYAPDKGSVTREKMFESEDEGEFIDEIYKTIAEHIDEFPQEENVIIVETKYNVDGI